MNFHRTCDVEGNHSNLINMDLVTTLYVRRARQYGDDSYYVEAKVAEDSHILHVVSAKKDSFSPYGYQVAQILMNDTKNFFSEDKESVIWQQRDVEGKYGQLMFKYGKDTLYLMRRSDSAKVLFTSTEGNPGPGVANQILSEMEDELEASLPEYPVVSGFLI